MNFITQRGRQTRFAHTLARNAIKVVSELVWIEEIPQCVSDVIQIDAVQLLFLLVSSLFIWIFFSKKKKKWHSIESDVYIEVSVMCYP